MPRKKASKGTVKNIVMKCGDKCMGMSDTFYSLGLIGAAVYYISMATSFWNGVVGLLKAIVWPAFLVYELLKYLKM